METFFAAIEDMIMGSGQVKLLKNWDMIKCLASVVHLVAAY